MHRRNVVSGMLFLLLVACAQVPAKASDTQSQGSEDNHKLQAIVMTPTPGTHPPAQDVAYNMHYPPVFPQSAIRNKHQGTVVLMIHVDAQGNIADIRIDKSSGYSELDASALVAVRQWRFMAAMQNGVAQSGWARVPVNFNLKVAAPSAEALQSNLTVQNAYRAEQQGDYATAYALLKPLAEQGNVAAQYSLGLFYRNGTGVARDDVQSVMWFRKAAEQGHANAENNLGLMYIDGRGVPKDFSQAEIWFERSALSGSAFGESNLGLTYLRGDIDGKPNYVVAYALLLSSSSRIQLYPGYAEGVANNLNVMQETMSQRQLTLGKQLAAQIDKNGLAVAMSNHWYGADYAVSDPCKPDANQPACDDEKYEAAQKNMNR
jgi:TonB family protein